MSAIDDYTIDDARHYGFGLLGLYKLWHWNNCIPHGPWHDELDEKMRATQRELDDRYQLLPMDADGEVIHIGDKITYHGLCERHQGKVLEVKGIMSLSDGIDAVLVYDTELVKLYANNCRHHHKPTVEDVLREFAIACEDTGNAGPEVQRLAGEYAKKLQLKEDE